MDKPTITHVLCIHTNIGFMCASAIKDVVQWGLTIHVYIKAGLSLGSLVCVRAHLLGSFFSIIRVRALLEWTVLFQINVYLDRVFKLLYCIACPGHPYV